MVTSITPDRFHAGQFVVSTRGRGVYLICPEEGCSSYVARGDYLFPHCQKVSDSLVNHDIGYVHQTWPLAQGITFYHCKSDPAHFNETSNLNQWLPQYSKIVHERTTPLNECLEQTHYERSSTPTNARIGCLDVRQHLQGNSNVDELATSLDFVIHLMNLTSLIPIFYYAARNVYIETKIVDASDSFVEAIPRMERCIVQIAVYGYGGTYPTVLISPGFGCNVVVVDVNKNRVHVLNYHGTATRPRPSRKTRQGLNTLTSARCCQGYYIGSITALSLETCSYMCMSRKNCKMIGYHQRVCNLYSNRVFSSYPAVSSIHYCHILQ